MFAALLLLLAPQVQRYLKMNAPHVILEHVDVIDGTGAPPLRDRNVKDGAAYDPGKLIESVAGHYCPY
jgi:hypothetical protein